jgi:hypothetical protein
VALTMLHLPMAAKVLCMFYLGGNDDAFWPKSS